jgi:hypothetical protein
VIPTIGLMIGMYIITRMVEMALYADRKAGTKVLGWITVAVAIFGMLNLIAASDMPTLRRWQSDLPRGLTVPSPVPTTEEESRRRKQLECLGRLSEQQWPERERICGEGAGAL